MYIWTCLISYWILIQYCFISVSSSSTYLCWFLYRKIIHWAHDWWVIEHYAHCTVGKFYDLPARTLWITLLIYKDDRNWEVSLPDHVAKRWSVWVLWIESQHWQLYSIEISFVKCLSKMATILRHYWCSSRKTSVLFIIKCWTEALGICLSPQHSLASILILLHLLPLPLTLMAVQIHKSWVIGKWIEHSFLTELNEFMWGLLCHSLHQILMWTLIKSTIVYSTNQRRTVQTEIMWHLHSSYELLLSPTRECLDFRLLRCTVYSQCTLCKIMCNF